MLVEHCRPPGLARWDRPWQSDVALKVGFPSSATRCCTITLSSTGRLSSSTTGAASHKRAVARFREDFPQRVALNRWQRDHAIFIICEQRDVNEEALIVNIVYNSA